MIDLDFTFKAPLWKWKGGNWHFITVPKDISDDIKAFTKHLRNGFGSLKVTVTVGQSKWATSIFPSKSEDAFLLPVKAAIRKAEGLQVDADIEVKLVVLV